MAQVVQTAFAELGDDAYQPQYPETLTITAPSPEPVPVTVGVSLRQLVDAGLLEAGSGVVASGTPDVVAIVTDDGFLALDGTTYDTPSAAARAVTDEPVNGWGFWLADTPDGQLTLDALRLTVGTPENSSGSDHAGPGAMGRGAIERSLLTADFADG